MLEGVTREGGMEEGQREEGKGGRVGEIEGGREGDRKGEHGVRGRKGREEGK